MQDHELPLAAPDIGPEEGGVARVEVTEIPFELAKPERGGRIARMLGKLDLLDRVDSAIDGRTFDVAATTAAVEQHAAQTHAAVDRSLALRKQHQAEIDRLLGQTNH